MIRARSGPAVVLVMLSTVTVSYTLVLSMVNPALEPLRVSFHASQAGISWVLTAYLLSSAVLTPFLGRVGDQLGKHRLIVAAAALLAAGSVAPWPSSPRSASPRACSFLAVHRNGKEMPKLAEKPRNRNLSRS
jgi:MFS family permease